MWPGCAVPHREMVIAGREKLSEGTNSKLIAVIEAALQECKRLIVSHFSQIMHEGENPVAWFYEIRDSNKVVAATGKGFDTNKAAMAAGRKKARDLKASGSLPGGGVATVRAGQDSEALVPHKERA